MIGIVAVVLTVLCAAGLVALWLFKPAGRHAAKGRHREQPHEGAGSEGHAEELHQLGVNPPVTLLHRENCHYLDEHVPPVGFNLDEPVWTGEHGESDHPNAVPEQCMCGHPRYHTCPDWASNWEPSGCCQGGQHNLCNGVGIDTAWSADVPNTCPCGCHDIPLSAAIKQLHGRRAQLVAEHARQHRDQISGS